MSKKCIYLTDNSENIRGILAKAGIKVCVCCSFKGYGWLNYYHREETDEHEVHAVIGCDDDVTEEVRHRIFLSEAKAHHEELIECKTAEEFINEIKKQM